MLCPNNLQKPILQCNAFRASLSCVGVWGAAGAAGWACFWEEGWLSRRVNPLQVERVQQLSSGKWMSWARWCHTAAIDTIEGALTKKYYRFVSQDCKYILSRKSLADFNGQGNSRTILLLWKNIYFLRLAFCFCVWNFWPRNYDSPRGAVSEKSSTMIRGADRRPGGPPTKIVV